MISMNNVSSAGGALHYFSADNYYTQDEGLEKSEWVGQGAKMLGLAGKVAREDFFNVLEGKVAGQELGRMVLNEKTGEQEREHRPGTDMTFSAPKSVSLLAEVAGNRDVREAHEAAVKAALSYIESELACTRQMKNGVLETVKTGNLTVATFRHNTSRELDPQTHTHAIIMNATRREDGEWRSLTNDEIYRAQRIVGAIYTGELADRLQALGFELRRTDERGNFEIVGVTREHIEHFSQRRAEIEASLKARGVDIDDASAQDKEDATLKTRAKKVDVDHGALISQWKERAASIGLDLAGIEARAQGAREQGGIMREDRLTGRQAMEFAAAHLIEREAVVPKEALMRTALEHGVGRVSPKEVEKAFAKLEKEGHLIPVDDQGNYTTAKMMGSERWALEQVKAQKGATQGVMSPDDFQKGVGRIEKRQGFAFTDGQREAIALALTTEDRFVGTQGLSGTGKTTMLRGLRELAQDSGYTVRGMAPTGAASKVLAKETGIDSTTVSMFLIKERQLQKDIEFAKQYAPDFERQRELWVVDESSFLSQRQKAQIDNMAIKAGAKVVYLGDKLQLQGVEAGKPFELAQRAGMETAQMTEISRQKTDVLKRSVDIITGRDALTEGQRLTNVQLKNNARAFEFMDKAGLVTEIREEKGKEGALLEKVVGDILDLKAAERSQTIVITAYNKDRHAINDGVRSGLQERGEVSRDEQTREILLSKGWTRAMQKEAQYYEPGDVVRFGRDYKQLDAKKGEYMEVVSSHAPKGIVTLRKADGSTIEWEPRKHNNIEVYDPDKRQLAVGDLIRITRNENELKNGEVAQVVSLAGDRAVLQMRADKIAREVDLSQNKHWDYAYASTVHAAQGATMYRTMFHIRADGADADRKPMSDLQAMAKVFGDRSFYVGATRATHEMRIYTNDKQAAAQAISVHQDKTSAVEFVAQRPAIQPEQRGFTR